MATTTALEETAFLGANRLTQHVATRALSAPSAFANGGSEFLPPDAP